MFKRLKRSYQSVKMSTDGCTLQQINVENRVRISVINNVNSCTSTDKQSTTWPRGKEGHISLKAHLALKKDRMGKGFFFVFFNQSTLHNDIYFTSSSKSKSSTE